MVESVVGSLLVSGFGLVVALVGVYEMHGGRAERARGDRIAETGTTAVRDLQRGPLSADGDRASVGSE
jgi:hypothetical protein